MRWVNSWFNRLKSHLGDGLFLFRQTSGRVTVHCRSHYVCLCLTVFSISSEFFLINFHTLFCLPLPRSFQHFGILVSFHILFCVPLLDISHPIHHCLAVSHKILPLLLAHVYNATVQGYNCTESLWIIWMSVQNCPHGMIQGPIKNWSNIDNLIRCAKTC